MSAAPHVPHLAAPAGSGPRRSLVLAGGGLRLAYQAGAIRALAEEGIRFSHFDGTSGGGINLSMILSGLSPVEAYERWRTLNVWTLLSLMPIEDYLKTWNLMALGTTKGLREKAFPHLGVDVEKIRAATGMEATYNVCNFNHKITEVFPHTEVDLDLIVAGMSLPVLLPPVAKGDTLYVDSAWIRNAHLMEGVRKGCDEVWLIWGMANTNQYLPNPVNQYVHMLELAAHGALFTEFDQIRGINQRIAAGESPYGQKGPVRFHLIRPEYPLPLDTDLFLGRVDAATLLTMGYTDARRYLAQRSEEGVPLQPESTRMKDSRPGISFREEMDGGFALGETDPQAGERAGKQQGQKLTMNATVVIRDLDRFLADPEHRGELQGHITFPPFGEYLPAKSGNFQLFSPSDQPKTRWMVYELGFEHGGKSYFLAGKKEVRDDFGLDLWKDTTTLFTRLHEGNDAKGPVVGAGILHLDPKELMKMIPTVTATNVVSPSEQAKNIARFGRFFLGELWDGYVRQAG